MGSQLHLFIKLLMPSAYKMNWLELVYLFIRSPNYFRTVSMDVSFKLFFACKQCNSLKHKNLICVHLIFGALRSILVRCKHYVSDARIAYLRIWLYVVVHRDKLWCEARFRHALTAEMSETFPSGGSMHASVKLEGIDGRAPQERVEHVA